MNQFSPKQDIQLRLKIVEQGVLFLFRRSNGDPGDSLQIKQSWSSLHALLSRLRNSQRYCAEDQPFLLWKQDEELHIEFHLSDSPVAEECVFSGEETRRILTMLERLPSMN